MRRLIITNYRSFGTDHPIELDFDKGIIALVGANNSGKSSALRAVFEFRHFFTFLHSNKSFSIKPQGFSFNWNAPRSHPSEIFHQNNTEGIMISLQCGEITVSFFVARAEDSAPTAILQSCVFKTVDYSKIENIQLTNDDELKNDSNLIINLSGLFEFYADLQNAIYFPSFRNAINIGGTTDYFDLKTGNTFIEEVQNQSTSISQVTRAAFYRVEDDLRNLFDLQRFSIKANGRDHTIVVQVDDRSFQLSDMGSGMSQFILIFLNAAMKKPSYILIDEPELNLHPKMQIDFVSNLTKYAAHGVIMATHSLGLADAVAGRVYAVSLDNNASVMTPIERTPDLPELLGEMNFSAFPQLGMKKILLVEGPTEVIVFQRLLRRGGCYKDFVVIPIGGHINSTGFLAFKDINRLGNKITYFCWIDSEKASEDDELSNQRKEFLAGCEAIKVLARASKRRKIENYYSFEAIKAVLPHADRELGPYETMPNSWNYGKTFHSGPIIDKMSLEDFKGTDLGDFLDEITKA